MSNFKEKTMTETTAKQARTSDQRAIYIRNVSKAMKMWVLTQSEEQDITMGQYILNLIEKDMAQRGTKTATKTTTVTRKRA